MAFIADPATWLTLQIFILKQHIRSSPSERTDISRTLAPLPRPFVEFRCARVRRGGAMHFYCSQPPRRVIHELIQPLRARSLGAHSHGAARIHPQSDCRTRKRAANDGKRPIPIAVRSSHLLPQNAAREKGN